MARSNRAVSAAFMLTNSLQGAVSFDQFRIASNAVWDFLC